MKSDHEEDSPNESHDHGGGAETGQHATTGMRPKGRLSFRAASHATLTFLSARKRIEGGLKNWKGRKGTKRDGGAEGRYGGVVFYSEVWVVLI